MQILELNYHVELVLERLQEALQKIPASENGTVRLYRGEMPGALEFRSKQLEGAISDWERDVADLIGRWYTFSIEYAMHNLFEHDRDFGSPRELRYLDIPLEQARVHYSLNRAKGIDDVEDLQELEFILPLEDVVSSKVVHGS